MISVRMRSRVSSRQSLRSRVRGSTNWEAGFPALDDLLAREATLAFAFVAESFFTELDFGFFISF